MQQAVPLREPQRLPLVEGRAAQHELLEPREHELRVRAQVLELVVLPALLRAQPEHAGAPRAVRDVPLQHAQVRAQVLQRLVLGALVVDEQAVLVLARLQVHEAAPRQLLVVRVGLRVQQREQHAVQAVLPVRDDVRLALQPAHERAVRAALLLADEEDLLEALVERLLAVAPGEPQKRLARAAEAQPPRRRLVLDRARAARRLPQHLLQVLLRELAVQPVREQPDALLEVDLRHPAVVRGRADEQRRDDAVPNLQQRERPDVQHAHEHPLQPQVPLLPVPEHEVRHRHEQRDEVRAHGAATAAPLIERAAHLDNHEQVPDAVLQEHHEVLELRAEQQLDRRQRQHAQLDPEEHVDVVAGRLRHCAPLLARWYSMYWALIFSFSGEWTIRLSRLRSAPILPTFFLPFSVCCMLSGCAGADIAVVERAYFYPLFCGLCFTNLCFAGLAIRINISVLSFRCGFGSRALFL